MSNLHDHAERELRAAGYFDTDGMYGGMLGHAVLAVIDAHAAQRHSGASNGICVRAFQHLAMFEPLSPLTGEDNEWHEVGPGVFQNTRCPRVFKENGTAYDTHGRVFRARSGMMFTGKGSRVKVTFPYTPITKYVRVGLWYRLRRRLGLA